MFRCSPCDRQAIKDVADILLLPPTHQKERWSWFCRAKVTKLREKTFSKRSLMFCSGPGWFGSLYCWVTPDLWLRLSFLTAAHLYSLRLHLWTQSQCEVLSQDSLQANLWLLNMNSSLDFFLQLAFNGGVLIDRLPLNPLWLKWGRVVQSDVPWPQCWPPVSLEDVLGNCILPVSPICHQLSPRSHFFLAWGQSSKVLNKILNFKVCHRELRSEVSVTLLTVSHP